MTQFGVSYYGNRFVNHAIEDLKRIAGCCDYVVHTVSESDLTYHKSVLAKIFAESRKLKLEVWADPWGLGGVFGGESFSKFLLEHRDSWQVMSDGRIMPVACLNRPEWKSYVREWILSVRDMGAQVIFWDEPHVAFDLSSEMSGIFSCTCLICSDLYRQRYGEKIPQKLNDHAREFRRQTLRTFLTEMMAYAKTKNIKNVLCLYAFKGNAEYEALWNEAAALKDLDIFGCDPYWRWHGHHNPANHVADFSRRVIQAVQKNNKESQVWIQAMRLPKGAEHEMSEAIEAAIREGITHIAAWSYDGGELLDPILSESPSDVWKNLEATYLRLRR